MKVNQEQVKSYAKVTLTRDELLAKVGFDTNDAFDVHLEDWGRSGVTFTLRGSASKYQGEPSKSESPAVAAPTTHGSAWKWLGLKRGGNGSRT